MFNGQCDSKWLHQSRNRAIVVLNYWKGTNMSEEIKMHQCDVCDGTGIVLMPTREDSEEALCPRCFARMFSHFQHPSGTVQHPSRKMVINKQIKGE